MRTAQVSEHIMERPPNKSHVTPGGVGLVEAVTMTQKYGPQMSQRRDIHGGGFREMACHARHIWRTLPKVLRSEI